MTIKKRLHLSFVFILIIIVFMVSVFFYTTYNLNQIHLLQNHRYDQIRRVEKLKDYNNRFAWIVLDVITDYNKADVVKDRMDKATVLFKDLVLKKDTVIENSESKIEKENLLLIFLSFEKTKVLIQEELNDLIVQQNHNFKDFNKHFNKLNQYIDTLLVEEINFLQNKLEETEKEKDQFIDSIQLELIILLGLAFLLSLIVSSKIIKEIQTMLNKLNKGVSKLLNNSENTIKANIGENNELSEITNNLNLYLEKQDDIIKSREELLRNISHELKTPITKGKFLLEQLKKDKENKIVENIDKVFFDIEELTNKLLEREKLNFVTLNKTQFKISTLVLESLSKLSIDNESKVIVDISKDFVIEGDFYYLTIVLKNLIDNAMKYSIKYPIKIQAQKDILSILNNAPKLSNDLIYYTQPFTREPNQQLGHGLGLNIVNKILKMHKFELSYRYNNSQNIFSITFL